jgi:hypothetical protein
MGRCSRPYDPPPLDLDAPARSVPEWKTRLMFSLLATSSLFSLVAMKSVELWRGVLISVFLSP